jgi:hypothetical protein
MNHSAIDRQSPLALFPGQPTPRPCAGAVQVLCTRPWHFLSMPTKRGFMQGSIDEG